MPRRNESEGWVSAAESERRSAGDPPSARFGAASTPAATRKSKRAPFLQVAAVDSFAARSLSFRPARLCRGLPARSAHPPSLRLRRGKPKPSEAIVVNRIEGSAR